MGEPQGWLFEPSFNRSVKVTASDARLTSDGGLVLLREADHRLGISEWLAQRLDDPRNPDQIRYQLVELFARIYALALGYSAQDDADRLALARRASSATKSCSMAPTGENCRTSSRCSSAPLGSAARAKPAVSRRAVGTAGLRGGAAVSADWSRNRRAGQISHGNDGVADLAKRAEWPASIVPSKQVRTTRGRINFRISFPPGRSSTLGPCVTSLSVTARSLFQSANAYGRSKSLASNEIRRQAMPRYVPDLKRG